MCAFSALGDTLLSVLRASDWQSIAGQLRRGVPVRRVATNHGVSPSTIIRKRSRDPEFRRLSTPDPGAETAAKIRDERARAREPDPEPEVEPEPAPETVVDDVDRDPSGFKIRPDPPSKSRALRPIFLDGPGGYSVGPSIGMFAQSDVPVDHLNARDAARAAARENVQRGLTPQGFATVITPAGSTSFDVNDRDDIRRAFKILAAEVGNDEAERLLMEAIP